MLQGDSSGAQGRIERTPEQVTRRELSRWKLLLHTRHGVMPDCGTAGCHHRRHILDTLVLLLPLDRAAATACLADARRLGAGLVLVTHREHAEWRQEQLARRGLVTSIVRAE